MDRGPGGGYCSLPVIIGLDELFQSFPTPESGAAPASTRTSSIAATLLLIEEKYVPATLAMQIYLNFGWLY